MTATAVQRQQARIVAERYSNDPEQIAELEATILELWRMKEQRELQETQRRHLLLMIARLCRHAASLGMGDQAIAEQVGLRSRQQVWNYRHGITAPEQPEETAT